MDSHTCCFTNHDRKRRGVAAVEFAIIAPLMMFFTFGLVEIGRFMMVKSHAVQATREGARAAVRPSATASQVVNTVEETLEILSINGAQIELEPSVLTTAAPGSMVTVRVTIEPSSISWVPGFFDAAIPSIVAETTMRRETTQ